MKVNPVQLKERFFKPDLAVSGLDHMINSAPFCINEYFSVSQMVSWMLRKDQGKKVGKRREEAGRWRKTWTFLQSW